MRLRERWQDEEGAGGGGRDDGDGSALEETRRRGERLMARAGEAIRKAESGESDWIASTCS